MILGKRTAKLVREAIVLAHVEGWMWGMTGPGDSVYPRDSDVVAHVLRASKHVSDLFPTLSKVEMPAQPGTVTTPKIVLSGE